MRADRSLAIAFALLLGVAGGAVAEDRTIPLAVEEAGFAPAEIEAPAGTRVRLEVTNRTPAAIEFESFELNRERVIQPGQTAAVYVSGLGPGRYEFFDDFHQQRRGALLVR
ncbi:MAG: cupredoxin domain-containing protein [Deltaproteobacteria bacterium]|nr:MAG: cupredoxin domain-containing protein [Deltaproteobacteria bacterium]